MTFKKVPDKFVETIKAKMQEQNIGVSQLARKIGVSHPTMVELITYGKSPSFNTCVALSAWLGISTVRTLRDAGLIPQSDSDQVRFEDWQYLIDQLPIDEQEEVRQIIQLKIERRQRAKPNKAQPAGRAVRVR